MGYARMRGVGDWSRALLHCFSTTAAAGRLALMSVINFSLDSDFKWLLLIPAVLWVIGLFVQAMGQRSP